MDGAKAQGSIFMTCSDHESVTVKKNLNKTLNKIYSIQTCYNLLKFNDDITVLVESTDALTKYKNVTL